MKRPTKANNGLVTKEFLKRRAEYNDYCGYDKPKWIQFCEIMLDKGFEVTIYEARRTVSKYVTVRNRNNTFKVRFSNHRPIKAREIAGDCDFFVGITNLKTTTTAQAVLATLKHFSYYDMKHWAENNGKNSP